MRPLSPEHPQRQLCLSPCGKRSWRALQQSTAAVESHKHVRRPMQQFKCLLASLFWTMPPAPAWSALHLVLQCIGWHNPSTQPLVLLLACKPQKREERQQAIDRGQMPDFLPETAAIRADDTWKGAPPAPGLVDRRVEITGPVDRKMVINALNSGATQYMADFEGGWPRQCTARTAHTCLCRQQQHAAAAAAVSCLHVPDGGRP
jgi:hypothetical protein